MPFHNSCSSSTRLSSSGSSRIIRVSVFRETAYTLCDRSGGSFFIGLVRTLCAVYSLRASSRTLASRSRLAPGVSSERGFRRVCRIWSEKYRWGYCTAQHSSIWRRPWRVKDKESWKYVRSEHESVPDPGTSNQRKGLEGFRSGYAVTVEVISTTSVAAAFSSPSQIPRNALMRVDLPVPEISAIAR